MRRKWIFRVAAMVLVPLLLLGVLEMLLRAFAYGYPTTFFVKTRINGKNVFVENQKFGLRFFPLSAVRSPPATVMPAQKPANTYRIFILGESAAMGDPEQAYGFWRYLQVMLEDRFPGTRFEVICAAMTGINSHAVLPIARECARHDGDLWIIYMGNNDMIGPFGPSHALRARAPSLSFIRATLALKTTKVGQLIASCRERLANRSHSAKSWQGMAMFLEHQIRHDDPGRLAAHEYFRENLEDILNLARKAKVKVVLSTVASNLKDCAPFASLHSPALSETQRAAWERLYKEGVGLETAGRFVEARAKYYDAIRIERGYADVMFRLGNCYLALTNMTKALRAFELARDYDALPFRTDSQLNAIISAVGRRADEGIRFADAAQTLAERSEHGIPGSEFFYEHVHLNFNGNYLVARIIGDEVAKVLPGSIADQDRGAWVFAERCADRLALTEWNRYHSTEAMLQRISVPPFTSQLNHAAQVQRLRDELSELKARMTDDVAQQARQKYQDALSAQLDDYLTRRKFAEFLSATGDSRGALEQWGLIRKLLPHHPIAWFRAGQLLAEAGDPKEAEMHLRKAVRIRSDFADAWLELGRVLAQTGKHAEAVSHYSEALRLQPGNASAHFHLANALVTQNKRPEAMEHLREAVRWRPAFWEARYVLGLELARAGDDAGARTQLSEVVRLRPDHAVAHLNLGVALFKQGRMPEALHHFRETLRLDPSNQMAQQHIAELESIK